MKRLIFKQEVSSSRFLTFAAARTSALKNFLAGIIDNKPFWAFSVMAVAYANNGEIHARAHSWRIGSGFYILVDNGEM